MNKLTVTILAVIMAAMLCACNVTTTKTMTDTENGVSTSTTITTENGETSSTTVTSTNLVTLAEDGELHSVALTIVNDSFDNPISEFYIKSGDDWGENLLSGWEIEPGEEIQGTFQFDENNLVKDIRIVSDGEVVSFSDCDFSYCNELEGVVLKFSTDNDQWSVDY